jgi:1,2-dihydroxy-3-keto-5-methylthiopentene dioxygenase
MAHLKFADGRQATADELTSIAQDYRIVIAHRPVPPDLVPLLDQPLLDDSASARILARFPAEPPYPSRDLIVLHPQRPDNAELATKFERWHRHRGDEVRYILDGSGVFRVVVDEEPAELHVEPGDYVNVPAGLEHNFRLTKAGRIKAIRYFSDPSGWVAEFTDRP